MTSTPPNRPLSFTGVVAGLVLCFALQGLVAFGLGWKATKTESNYFSSLIRFQAAASGPAELTVVGSSITGRLPGREMGNPDVANLGTDGGSSADGLRLLCDGRMRTGKWVILETNTFLRVVLDPPSTMLDSVGGAAFRAGAGVPALGYSARPTGMLYGKLLNRKAGGGEVQVFPLAADAAPVAEAPVAGQEATRYAGLVDMIGQLQAKGCRVLLVEYPSEPMAPEVRAMTDRGVAYVTARTRVPFLDLARQIPRDRLTFTDTVHLSPGSARDVLESLRNFLVTQP
ncbi:hypothetical protein [Luteolibacter sp. LG18]|uniref:hypothetical protein n=1 Tax=Luteolibacter sp. LG18 TaxID=2819286 RepID=UPI002B29F1D0|nr:hypothetical protein llg_16350 [Luteolibacter sp. LG18]